MKTTAKNRFWSLLIGLALLLATGCTSTIMNGSALSPWPEEPESPQSVKDFVGGERPSY